MRIDYSLCWQPWASLSSSQSIYQREIWNQGKERLQKIFWEGLKNPSTATSQVTLSISKEMTGHGFVLWLWTVCLPALQWVFKPIIWTGQSSSARMSRAVKAFWKDCPIGDSEAQVKVKTNMWWEKRENFHQWLSLTEWTNKSWCYPVYRWQLIHCWKGRMVVRLCDC